MKEYLIGVDGSYLDGEAYGGICLLDRSDRKCITIRVTCPKREFISSRNIYGEVAAAIIGFGVAKQCLETTPDCTFTIVYDYLGIKNWLTGEWQSKKPIAAVYKHVWSQYPELHDKIKFHHVKGHQEVTDLFGYVNQVADNTASGKLDSPVVESDV